MADHLHNWYDETTTKEKINDSPDNVDAIQESFKEVHPTKECPLEKEDKAVEQREKFKVRTTMGKENMKEPVPHDLPRTLFLGHLKEQIEEQDYDIPLHDGVMQPLTPQTVHITPSDDDYVAPATNPILDKQLNEFGKEFSDITRVAKKANCNPVNDEEQFADEKERKARTLLLMAVPKDHLRRFHGMDDAKEIWAAIKTRFGGNANSKKMQKAVLKQQFEAFTISSKESLEKGYDRFQKLLSQLDALGAGVSDEDANHKFLRSLPPAWDSLAMTMRTKKNIDTLSIDDLYNNLSVFEQDIQKTSSSSLTSDNVAFLSQAKASSSKHKPSHSSGSYSSKASTTATPGLADEVIHSFLATNADDVDLIHEDLDQIDDLDLEEMDINWQIAMTAIKIKKFYKKTGRRPRVDGKMHVAFDKRKVECFNCHNTGHFARECKFKGSRSSCRKQ
ncbi:ribonuclease H-like domain-containing protein [Tanacetum coccineum]